MALALVLIAAVFTIVGLILFIIGVFIVLNTGDMMMLIMMAAALPCLVIGVILLRYIINISANVKRIKQKNITIYATIDNIIEDYSIVINNIPGFTLEAVYTDFNGQEYVFRSEVMTKWPTEEDNIIGKQVKIYLDKPNKYEGYVFDKSCVEGVIRSWNT